MDSTRQIASLAVVTLLTLCACATRVPGGTSASIRCPEHEIQIFVDSTDPVTDIHLAEDIDEIPEFHDCQRFPSPTGNPAEYGPLVAIWAVQDLATVFAADLEAVAAGSADTPWRAVAQIFDYGTDYAPLGIRRLFNCLQLRRVRPSPGSSDGWAARIVPIGKNPKSCEPVSRDTAFTGVLEVRATTADPADLPAVARWDLEPGPRGRQYIGIRCGEEWCEVGPRDFVSSRPVLGSPLGDAFEKEVEDAPDAGPLGAEKLRVIRVRGWYDQQPLATMKSGVLRRSDTIGTIIPHPGLATITDPERFDNRWIPAAYVHVTHDYKWLESSTPAQTFNRLYICRESGSRMCPGRPASSACATSGGARWWTRIDRPASGPIFRCVHFDGSAGVIPAAAARWRWLEDDETTWVRCAGGCCSTR
jgi:hypothetical protein